MAEQLVGAGGLATAAGRKVTSEENASKVLRATGALEEEGDVPPLVATGIAKLTLHLRIVSFIVPTTRTQLAPLVTLTVVDS